MSKKVRSRKINKASFSEDYGIVNGSRLRGGKIRIKDEVNRGSVSRIRETKADKEIEKSDSLSLGLMVLVIVICFVVGISIGYILYNISITG